MADILPLRGIHYSPAAVGGDLGAVVAPPYDVISPDEQAALYARSPHNVVRLILGREDDKYARAAALFQDWLSEGVWSPTTRPPCTSTARPSPTP